MNRYLKDPEALIKRDCEVSELASKYYDVIIVGSGLAGLYTALNCSSDLRIALVCKDAKNISNSELAQGGIAVTMTHEGEESHVLDTLLAGSYANNLDAVNTIVNEGKKHIHKLIEWGADFDRDEHGNLLSTQEGGHSSRRVLHYQDATGKEVMRALNARLHLYENIQSYFETVVVDVLSADNRAVGLTMLHGGEFQTLYANQVVLATGGIGQLYSHTTNSRISTGDGIAVAKRAGAQLMDMEMVQFHPSAFYQQGTERHFLISEAVRGEGGILRNSDGFAFMADAHPQRDLAPRDIVAREIFKQTQLTKKPFVYLDVTHLKPGYIKGRFPMIYETLLEAGYNMSEDLIPVCPVEHYHMGGIQTDLWGRTSISGLYAVGEVACTGVHGANRLASNSLLEALVFGARVAKQIEFDYALFWKNPVDLGEKLSKLGTVLIDMLKTILKTSSEPKMPLPTSTAKDIFESVRTILTNDGFIYRTESSLSEGIQSLMALQVSISDLDPVDSEGILAHNSLICAIEILQSALSRKNSLGAHQILEEGTSC